MSLVANGPNGPTVTFVRWKSPHNREARPVRLDERNRIIFDVAVKCESFIGWDIVIRNVGVSMAKATGPGRTPMPAWCLLIKNPRHASLFAGPLPRDSPYGDCVVCVQTDGMYLPPEGDDLYVCSSCLAAWHVACSRVSPFRCLTLESVPLVCPP